MDRRDFLKLGILLPLAASGKEYSVKKLFSSIKTDTKIKSTEIVLSEIDTKLEKSKKYIGKIEYNHFIKYFGLVNNKNNIYNKIISIQKKYGLKTDGILGSKTLEIIYKKYYSKDLDNVGADIKDRWEAYIDIKNMGPRIKGKNRYYGRFNKNNIFKKRHWTGLIGEYSEEGSYIDDNLKDKVKYNISDIHCNVENPENKVVGILTKINGKYVTLIYDKGDLILASYSSPGVKNGRPGYNKTKKGFYNTGLSQKNFVSSVKARPIGGNKFSGAPMYYSVHLYGGVYSHYSPTVNGNRASHQCLRQSMRTAKKIYYIHNNIGHINWDIQEN